MSDWTIGESKTVLHTFIWDVIETEKTNPNGKAAKFISLKAPSWVSAVIKDTDTNKFVMVKEFRHGVNKWVYEFPSGTMEAGENPEDTVIREVKEETGFKNVKLIRKLYTANPNPAFHSNHMNCFYLEVSGKPENQSLDENEFINMTEVENPESYIDNDDSSVMGKLAWAKYKELLSEK